jgi:cation/acetate symporter
LAGATALAIAAANSIGHDIYGAVLSPKAAGGRKLVVSRLALLLLVGGGAGVAAHARDLSSLAASMPAFLGAAFFPPMILGLWWRRATPLAATAGMVSGLVITSFYVAVSLATGSPPAGFPRLGGGLIPAAAAIYGLPIGFLVMLGVTWATPTTVHPVHHGGDGTGPETAAVGDNP